MKQSNKTLMLWLVMLAMGFMVWAMLKAQPHGTNEVSYNEFLGRVQSFEEGDEPEVREVTIQGNHIEGRFSDGKTFVTTGPISEKSLDLLVTQGTKIQFVEEGERSIWLDLILSMLPIIVLFGIFIFFMRQLQSGGGKAMSFGKSRARLLNSPDKKITFKDVAGIEEAKEEVVEIIDFLKDPKRFTRLGGRIPKGVLLVGPPGTGKTLLARAIAGEAGVPFFTISGSDFVEMFVGVGASRVRDLFEQGKKNAPCIIFIDEIDAVGRHRGAGLGGGHDEREQTLNQLLVEMDGFESNDGVILVSATNRPDVLDPALLRPGRFDRRVVVPRPDLAGRLGILKVHSKDSPLESDVDLEVIARGTPGFSGADLENLVNEAALLAARRSGDRVQMSDFLHAKDKVLLGAERKSMIISEKEKKVTAYHEAGHAIVAAVLSRTENYDPVQKVTIIPRGMALGLTQTLPEEDKYTQSRSYILATICYAMGGRAAEELIYDERTTGAGNDIERSTALARKMVTEWGMSEKMGPLNFGSREEHLFLGREVAKHQDYSDKVAEDIDTEVRSIVETQYDRAFEILKQYREQLDSLAEHLLKYETLDGIEIMRVIDGEVVERPVSENDSDSSSDAGGGEKGKKRNSWLGPLNDSEETSNA